MSIPKDELHRLVDALPEGKTAKAKDFLEVLVSETNEKKVKQGNELTLGEKLRDVIGSIDGNGDIARHTEEKFGEIVMEKHRKERERWKERNDN